MDFNITNFNERLKSIKLRELIVAGIAAIILGVILSEIFPAIYDSDDLYFVVITILILVFFIYALKGTYGLKTNIHSVFETGNQKEIIYVFLINIFFAMVFLALFSSLDIMIGFLDPSWETGFEFDYVSLTPIAFFIDEFGGMISAFLFGICMCILYLKTDNILIPITVHFINNLVVTLLESTHIDTIMLEFPWIIPTLIICLISSVLLILYIYKGFKKVKTLT